MSDKILADNMKIVLRALEEAHRRLQMGAAAGRYSWMDEPIEIAKNLEEILRGMSKP